MAITNKEIARQLGISETTLSFIIHDKPGISEKTKKKVVDEIYRMGYGDIFLKRKGTSFKNICFCVYNQERSMLGVSPFFLLLLGEIDQQAQKSGFNTIIRHINSRDSIISQVNSLHTMDLSGLLLFGTEMKDDDILPFKNLNIPVVVLDNDFSAYELDSVVINNQLGTHKAVECLVRRGHRQIGYLRSDIRINSFLEREAGFRAALAAFDLGLEPRFVYDLAYGEKASYKSFLQVLKNATELPTALVTDDDLLAAGAARALVQEGISIPEQVALVGFNDRPICEEISPKLTSIQVPKKAFGRCALDILLERMERNESGASLDEAEYQKVLIGVRLVERAST